MIGSNKKSIIQKGKALHVITPFVQTDLFNGFFNFYSRIHIKDVGKAESAKLQLRPSLRRNNDLSMFIKCLDTFYNQKSTSEIQTIPVQFDAGMEIHTSQNQYTWTSQFDMLLSFYIDYLQNLNELNNTDFLQDQTYGKLRVTKNNPEEVKKKYKEANFEIAHLQFKDYIQMGDDGPMFPTKLNTVVNELFSKTKSKIGPEPNEKVINPEWCKYFKLRGHQQKERRSPNKNTEHREVIPLDNLEVEKKTPLDNLYHLLGNLQKMTEENTSDNEKKLNSFLMVLILL